MDLTDVRHVTHKEITHDPKATPKVSRKRLTYCEVPRRLRGSG